MVGLSFHGIWGAADSNCSVFTTNYQEMISHVTYGNWVSGISSKRGGKCFFYDDQVAMGEKQKRQSSQINVVTLNLHWFNFFWVILPSWLSFGFSNLVVWNTDSLSSVIQFHWIVEYNVQLYFVPYRFAAWEECWVLHLFPEYKNQIKLIRNIFWQL